MPRLIDPGARPGAWDTIGDLAKRVARLEAVPQADPDVDTVAYGFWQVNVYTISAGAGGVKVPDVDWLTAFSPTPLGITLSSGVWTISIPGVYMVSSGCRFASTSPSVTGGIFNFSLINATIADHQTAVPIGSLYASNLFEANPGNSMMFDTHQDLSNNAVDHQFDNTSDVDVDVGYVNLSIWRIGPSTTP